jgi:hypothetical protein
MTRCPNCFLREFSTAIAPDSIAVGGAIESFNRVNSPAVVA